MKDTITTTIRITKKQKQWIKNKNISLSLLIQAFLDEQMKKNK